MRRALAPERVWPTRDFFEAKVAEQTARHHRYHDTAYNLEPNVKSSPGGLRDIQTIGWVAKRHFGGDSLEELVEHGFLAKSELRKLKTAQAFLWKIRFALHVLTEPPRGPAAVRSPDPAREDVRLRGRDLHARSRAVHAALLPHGDGREPAQRNAAAAVPRSDPHRTERRAGAGESALPDPQRLPRGHERRRLRPLPVGAARAVRRARSRTRRSAACAPRPSAS